MSRKVAKVWTNCYLTKVIKMYKGENRRVLEELKGKYLKTEKGQDPVRERNEGAENKELDHSFTMTEL
ncbi:hypothetical protein MRX96_056818 [Rhipicephalus microplus]